MERILVVEDDDSTRELLTEALGRWGYESEAVVNGKQGLEKFQSRLFSVIITDIRMPGMDGLSMLRRIRKRDKKIPIIVITGYPSVDSAVDCLVEGADNYLVKPINLDDLKAKINKAFEKRRIQRSLDVRSRLNLVLLLLIPVWIGGGYLLGKMLR